MDKEKEPLKKKLPEPRKGDGDGSDEYRTPEDPAPEIDDPHRHNFGGRQHGDRQSA